MAAAARGQAEAPAASALAPPRPSSGAAAARHPGGPGRKWSEVCERVQQPDGSVRTPAVLKSGVAALASPPRLRGPTGTLGVGPGGLRCPSRSNSLCVPLVACNRASSRGGSSRGCSSGKSSRSSSRELARDGHSRDGDISSGCSLACWETSTSSSDPSWPKTPPDVAPQRGLHLRSPFVSRGLLMPDPIRTSLILPPALLDLEHTSGGDGTGGANGACGAGGAWSAGGAVGAGGASGAGGTSSAGFGLRVQPASGGVGGVSGIGGGGVLLIAELHLACCAGDEPLVPLGTRPGMPLKKDPFGRDGACRRGGSEARSGTWTAEPLVKYLKVVALQIDSNLRDERLPTAERLDAFVSKLVSNAHRQLKLAPKKVRHPLQALFSRRFQKFWDFARNEKVRHTTPEELKLALVALIEHLASEFAVRTDPVAQPKPVQCHECPQLPRRDDASGG